MGGPSRGLLHSSGQVFPGGSKGRDRDERWPGRVEGPPRAAGSRRASLEISEDDSTPTPPHSTLVCWGGHDPLGVRPHERAPGLGKVLSQATKQSMDCCPELTRGSHLHVGTCGKLCRGWRVNPWRASWLHTRITNREGELLQIHALSSETEPQGRASRKAEWTLLPGDKPGTALVSYRACSSSHLGGRAWRPSASPRSVHSCLRASFIHSANAHQGPAVSQALS